MSIKLIIADDHRVVREGFRALLETRADLVVVAEAEGGREAIRLVRDLEVDIVIMDVAMSDMNGIEATRQIKKEIPEIKVIALSMYPSRGYVSEMLMAGASGYLLKNCAFNELVNAIHAVYDGQIFIPPQIAGVVVGDYVSQLKSTSQKTSPFSSLSSREREVLQLVAEGNSSKEIASRLNVSMKTAGFHRQKIMKKLSIHSIAELTKFAVREGITPLES